MKTEPTINWEYSKTGKLIEGTLDATDAYVVGMAYIVDKIKEKKQK